MVTEPGVVFGLVCTHSFVVVYSFLLDPQDNPLAAALQHGSFGAPPEHHHRPLERVVDASD